MTVSVTAAPRREAFSRKAPRTSSPCAALQLLERLIDALAVDGPRPHEPGYRLAMLGDDDLLASRDLVQQRGEMGLRLESPDRDHQQIQPRIFN